MRNHDALFEDNPDAVFILDDECHIVGANKSCADVSGFPVEELLGVSFATLIADDDLAGAVRHIREAGKSGRVEFSIARRGGRRVELEADIFPDGDGADGKYLVARDITDRKASEAQLRRRALHDPLTDLPNRTLFGDRLAQALARIGKYGGSAAVLFIDLDGFKTVNDGFGHSAGDLILVSVAEILRSSIRPEDTVARLGGDEFVILLENLAQTSDADWIAERILRDLRRSTAAETHAPVVTASIGIAWQHGVHGRDEVLVRNADSAMYRAKNRGGNRYEVYDRQPTSHASNIPRTPATQGSSRRSPSRPTPASPA